MSERTVEQVIEALKLSELSPEEQESILLELQELIFKNSVLRLVERMDDTTREDFSQLMESDAEEEEVEAFLREKVPGADQIIADTIRELTDDILSVTEANNTN